MLQNDFLKQRYITFNATIPGEDSIYTNTHLCRTFFAGYICFQHIFMLYEFSFISMSFFLICLDKGDIFW